MPASDHCECQLQKQFFYPICNIEKSVARKAARALTFNSISMHNRVVVALSGKYARKWALKNPVGTTGGNNVLTLVFKLTIFVSK